jgi:uncharacterized protein (TIGR00290 family)
MHGVRQSLLQAQASAIGIPLLAVLLPTSTSHDAYEQAMASACEQLRGEGIATVAFGDIFLQDLRAYREKQLAKAGLKALFPLWSEPTDTLVLEMERTGIQATIVCIDGRLLDSSLLGRTVNAGLLSDLPEGVDPCGERGEFHSFVTDAPFFKWPVPVRHGEIVQRSYPAPDGGAPASFLFLDLLPAG